MSDGEALSFEALATSRAFSAALVRDVHILVESFALTWSWLDNGANSEPHLRWRYGSFVVFERVWCTNGWSRVDTALGTERGTRRAFYAAISAALLDKLTGTNLLHAIGAAFALYLLVKSQHSHTWPRIPFDIPAYRALIELPERSRGVLDVPAAARLPPPSADVYHVVINLLGHGELRTPLIEVRVPSTQPRLAHATALVRRRDLDNKEADYSAAAQEAIIASLGIPSADDSAPSLYGTSMATARAADALAHTHTRYIQARTELLSWAATQPPWMNPTGSVTARIAEQVRASLN